MTETIRLDNGELSVEVSSLGAEMQSLASADGRQWLWNGDGEWWSGRSPILFPIVGKAPEDTLAIDGKAYAMKQHGLARRREFALIGSASDVCRHQLAADDETMASYPFDFRLELEHRLTGRVLTVTATVTNAGFESMPYGIGFHPAFLWPLPGATGLPHRITLENGKEPDLFRLKDGMLSPEKHLSPFIGGHLMLEHRQFEADAMIFPEGAGDGLTYDVAEGPALKFTFRNLPNLALWQKPGAPFICIEPWHGMAAHLDGSAELTERPFTAALAPGEKASYGFSVELPA